MTSTAKILIVEDDRIVARDIEQQLLRLGYAVAGLTARGDEALALALSTKADLVLMDVRLQGPVDGVDAARLIHQQCNIPVVFLTAYADDETVRRASLAEPFGYVLKPFEDSQLRTVIGMALYKHASEQRLRNSERRYAVTLASIGDAVIATDEKQVITFMNPAAEALTGWREREAAGVPLGEVFRVADSVSGVPIEAPMAAILAGGTTLTRAGTMTLRGRDGREIVIDDRSSPIIDDRGVMTGVALVFRDVTARRQAEEAQALRDGELRWRTMTEALPHLIWTVSADGVPDYFSPQCCVYLGLTEADIIGIDVWLQNVHPDDRQRCASAWRAAFATETKHDVEMRLRRHDGIYLWFHSVAVPVRDAQGRVTRWFGTSTDISARKLAESAMLEAKMAAESANHAKNRFLANISHELRTPLNGILGYAQILRGDGAMNERQQDGINVIEQSGEYLLALINDILDFSRIEARKLDLEIADIPLEKFLRVIVEIMSMRAREKGIELVCNLPPSLPHAICADERRLRQVLLNLLANAVRFTDYGEVRLSVAFAPPDRLKFSIADTGIGIAPEALEAIFRPFEQAGELPRRTGGAGLGLAISRQLVRLMGSDILVSSEVDAGSTFWFELQVGELPGYLERQQSEPVARGYAGPRKRVLVADDVRANRAVVVEMLGALGFETIEVEDGEAALACVARENIDLILMDAVMPKLDGIDAIRLLKADPRQRSIPIIAISANVSGQNKEKCLQAGAEVFLHKPINLLALTEQVRRLLELTWLYDAPAAPDPVSIQPAPMVYPPAGEIEILHRMALQGNMRAISERAIHLCALDARYTNFSAQLRDLARGFQSKATLRLIEQVMKEQNSGE